MTTEWQAAIETAIKLAEQQGVDKFIAAMESRKLRIGDYVDDRGEGRRRSLSLVIEGDQSQDWHEWFVRNYREGHFAEASD